MTVKKQSATKPAAPEPEPESESELFDLDAAIAEVPTDEAAAVEFKFSYGGKKWKFRPAVDANAKLLGDTDLSEVQQVMSYIRDLLGDEQWEAFPRISLTGALTLVEAFAEHTQGVGAGESEASGDS